MQLTKKQKENIAFRLGQEFALACPKISTRMARAFTSTSKVKIEGNEIVYTLPYYADYVINGSSPHTIEVKNKKMLACPVNKYTGKNINPYGSGKFPMLSKDGKFVMFGKKINHPGNAPNDFLKEVMHQKLNKIINDVVKSS